MGEQLQYLARQAEALQTGSVQYYKGNVLNLWTCALALRLGPWLGPCREAGWVQGGSATGPVTQRRRAPPRPSAPPPPGPLLPGPSSSGTPFPLLAVLPAAAELPGSQSAPAGSGAQTPVSSPEPVPAPGNAWLCACRGRGSRCDARIVGIVTFG